MGRFLTAAISLIIMMLFASAVIAEEAKPKFPPDERINVPSLTLTNEQFLGGDMANGVARDTHGPPTVSQLGGAPAGCRAAPRLGRCRQQPGVPLGPISQQNGNCHLPPRQFQRAWHRPGWRGPVPVECVRAGLRRLSRRRCAGNPSAHRSVPYCRDGLFTRRRCGALLQHEALPGPLRAGQSAHRRTPSVLPILQHPACG